LRSKTAVSREVVRLWEPAVLWTEKRTGFSWWIKTKLAGTTVDAGAQRTRKAPSAIGITDSVPQSAWTDKPRSAEPWVCGAAHAYQQDCAPNKRRIARI
jgi:hypothetical protein